MTVDKQAPKKERPPVHSFVEISLHFWNASIAVLGPAPRAAALWQIEMMGLTNRNLRASAKLVEHALKCRTPQELSRHQLAHLSRATADLAESSDRLLRSWANSNLVPSLGVDEVKRQHDHVELRPAGQSQTADEPELTSAQWHGHDPEQEHQVSTKKKRCKRQVIVLNPKRPVELTLGLAQSSRA